MKGKEISRGALYGAWNNDNDPYHTIRDRVAESLYKEIINRKKEYEIEAVSKNTGFSISDVERIYYHIFIRKHLFRNGRVHKFDPDYYTVHSWLRLREGKTVYKHDITMLHHELEEEKIMGDSLEIVYEDAHDIVAKKYNYEVELVEYLKKHDV